MADHGTYTLTSLSVHGRALRAKVTHTAPDGRTAVREYSWPVETSREDMLIALADQHRRFLAAPPAPPAIHDAMDVVGKPIDGEQ